MLRNHAELRAVYSRSVPLGAPLPPLAPEEQQPSPEAPVLQGKLPRRVIRITAEQLELGLFPRHFELN